MFEDRLKTAAEDPQPRILLYGREKGGKTTFASEFPNVLIIDLDRNGASQINVPRLNDVASSDDLICLLKEIGTNAKDGNKPYDWIVIDTLTELANMIGREICALPENASAKHIGDNAHKPFSYGAGFAMVAARVGIILNLMDRLLDYGIKPILVAHSKAKVIDNPLDSPYDKFELETFNAVGSLVKKWVDCILFLKDRQHVTKEKKALPSSVMIYAERHPAYEGGGRYSIPNFEYKLGHGYETFNKLLKQSTNKTGE